MIFTDGVTLCFFFIKKNTKNPDLAAKSGKKQERHEEV